MNIPNRNYLILALYHARDTMEGISGIFGSRVQEIEIITRRINLLSR